MPSVNPPVDAAPANPLDAALAVLLFVLPFVAIGAMAFAQNTVGFVVTGVLVVVVLAAAWVAVGAEKK